VFEKAIFNVRGGSDDLSARPLSTETKYVKLSDPAPGSPFHLALPVHNLEIAKDFYGNILGCAEVPVPHFGLALTVDQFHELAKKLNDAGIKFIIEPHLRFQGQPGEQWTMFFKDPSGNNLEFKAMTHTDNLFAKYNVL
jgi:extradiol dioxygenase family protein